MAANTRFAVALHVLGYLVYSRDESSTSDELAESVNTNPVVIRRLLAALREAGLVSSQAGPGGGWKLERSAEQISLAEIYRAVEDEPLFALPIRDPSDDCEVGAHVHAVFSRISSDAEHALIEHLANSTIADVVAEIARRVGPCPLDLAQRERQLS
jgi:Rrf2 family protein